MNQNYSKRYRQIYFRIMYFHMKKQNPDVTITRCFRGKAARKRHLQMSFLEINNPSKISFYKSNLLKRDKVFII